MSSDNFFPRNVCPIDDLTRQWIDARASWLVYQFGAEQIRSCPIILPTVDFFPDDYRETAADARNMLIRLCDYLEVEAESVDLAFFNTPIPINDGTSASGLDPDDGARIRIWIDHAELHKPLSMATTIIAELCRVRLLGDCEIALSEVEQEAELEHLIDLTAVFLGLGVIVANASLHFETWQIGEMGGWRMQRKGHFTLSMYGYALALFSRFRGETAPIWATQLRPDVLDAFRKSLIHFEQRGVPNLRTLTTTAVRDDRDQGQSQCPDTEIAGCNFCGAVLQDDDTNGVCKDCHMSIDENSQAIECDYRLAEAERRTKLMLLRLGCVLVVAAILVLAVLDWLDVIS